MSTRHTNGKEGEGGGGERKRLRSELNDRLLLQISERNFPYWSMEFQRKISTYDLCLIALVNMYSLPQTILYPEKI